MEISEYTEVLLDAKDEKGLTFESLGKTMGRSEMWVAALLYGQMQATAEEAGKVVDALGLEEDREAFEYFLTSFPSKTTCARSSRTFRIHRSGWCRHAGVT